MEFRRAFDPVRALGSAWRLILRAPLTLIAGGVFIALTGGGFQNFSFSFEDERLHWFGALAVGSIMAVACCFGLILWTINSFLRVGLARATLRVMATGTESFSDLLEGRELWVPMLLARFLKALLGTAALLPLGVIAGGPIVLGGLLDLEEVGILVGILLGLLYVPIWIYIALGLVLVESAVALEAKDPIGAIQRSWQIASGNRVQLLLYFVVSYVVAFSGVCLCCIGVLFTSALTSIAWTESYSRFALPAPEGGWWIDGPQVPSPR